LKEVYYTLGWTLSDVPKDGQLDHVMNYPNSVLSGTGSRRTKLAHVRHHCSISLKFFFKAAIGYKEVFYVSHIPHDITENICTRAEPISEKQGSGSSIGNAMCVNHKTWPATGIPRSHKHGHGQRSFPMRIAPSQTGLDQFM